MYRHYRLLLSLTILFIGSFLNAHPVPFKGATSVMTWNQPHMNETMAIYSFHRFVAAGGQYLRMEMGDGEMKAAIPQLDLLAKRWNQLDSQANIYFIGGFGAYEFDNGFDRRQGSTALGGVETDWESQKYYLSAKFTGLWPSFGKNDYNQTYRAGIAAYPAEFNEMSAWLILDIQHASRLEQKWTVTPVLRTFYKNILTEIGTSFTGDWMLNFMIHL